MLFRSPPSPPPAPPPPSPPPPQASRTTTPATLDLTLDWAKQQLGLSVKLVLGAGDYGLSALDDASVPGIVGRSLLFDATSQASHVLLTAEEGAVVTIDAAHDAPALVVAEGSVVLEGLELRGARDTPAIFVSGGQLTLRRCRLRDSNGHGAVRMIGGEVVIEDSELSRNSHRHGAGGAVAASGGSLHLLRSNLTDNVAAVGGGVYVQGMTTVVRVDETLLRNNSALVSGGGVHVAAGQLVASHATLLEGNRAPNGSSVAIAARAAALMSYQLPTPAGRWVFAIGTAAQMSAGDRVDEDYPFACAPGVFGEEGDLAGQRSPACSGPCPAGFSCAGGTVHPQPCLTHGTYCPMGSPMATPCPPGKTSYRGGLASVDDCVVCPAGTFCSGGRLGVCGKNRFSGQSGADNQAACSYCPVASSTAGEGKTRLSDCVCDAGHFALMSDDGSNLTCALCPVGANCTGSGSSLESLELLEGYWRIGSNSTDVRRCPGALSGSRCVGGVSSGERVGPCREWLQGPYCSLCNVTDNSRFFDNHDQECKACEDVLLQMVVITLVVAAIVLAALACYWFKLSRTFRCLARALAWLSRLASQRAKLKQLLGFYQVVTRIGDIYSVPLPAEVAKMLAYLDVFNINLAGLLPMQCFGLGSYERVLAATLITPLVLAAVIIAVCLGRSCLTNVGSRTTRLQRGLLAALRWLLSLTFLVLPTVTSAAFQAFSCEDFDDGRRYLRADYSIECGGDAHGLTEGLAWTGIAFYPIGVLLLYAVLLARVWPAVTSEKPTPLSRAMDFLVRDVTPAYLWWDLAEAWKKLFLVGFAVLLRPGSIEQLIIGFLVALVFLLLASVAHPFRSTLDDVFLMACSFALVAVFFFSIVLRVAVLAEETSSVLTVRMLQLHDFNPLIVIVGMGASVLSGLVGASIIGTMQLISAARQPIIRLTRTKSPPELTLASRELRYHLFLSHIWSSAQDQAATIKRQLQLLVPTASIFLDIDDLEDIGQLERYVAETQCVLIMLSRGYFGSYNCKRELDAALNGRKPLVLVHETDEKKGGAPLHQLRGECSPAVRAYVFGVGAGGQAQPGQREVIPWHRIASFQLVSLKLIVQGMLAACPEFGAKTSLPELYVSNEHPRRRLAFRSPVHLYVSRATPGAVAVASVLKAGMGGHIGVTTSASSLPTRRRPSSFGLEKVLGMGLGSIRVGENAVLAQATHLAGLAKATHMLLYLTSQTFTGDSGERLANDLRGALAVGLPIVMVHENDPLRNACPFDTFFQTTPQDLIDAGLYHGIATAWYPDAYRSTSIALIALRLGASAHRLLGRQGSAFMTSATVAAADAAAAALPAAPVAVQADEATRLSAAQPDNSHEPSTSSDQALGSFLAAVKGSSCSRPTGEVSEITSEAAAQDESRRTIREQRRRSLHAADSAQSLIGHKDRPGREVSERRKSQLAHKAVNKVLGNAKEPSASSSLGSVDESRPSPTGSSEPPVAGGNGRPTQVLATARPLPQPATRKHQTGLSFRPLPRGGPVVHV